MAQQPNQFKLLKTLHLSVVAGITLFLIVAMVLFGMRLIAPAYPLQDRNFQLIAVAFSIISVYIGFRKLKSSLLELHRSAKPAAEKMQLYRAVLILWWAMLEVPGIVATIGFLLTGNFAFVALASVHIMILVLFRPRRDNIKLLLQLKDEEVAELEGK